MTNSPSSAPLDTRESSAAFPESQPVRAVETTAASERIRSLKAFLYRRLARWITCQIRLLGKHPLAFDSKYQVNSLQDVFCHPFYWQIYGWLPNAPELIVDLGAHCGHFSMLADVCFRVQFPGIQPDYILIEPNPKLVNVIRNNLAQSGLCPRHVVHQGLVGGRRDGSATLWISAKNYLSASLARGSNTSGVDADFFDLESVVGGRRIDLLKIDIEGAEFDFVEQYPELLERVLAVMVEIHKTSEDRLGRFHAQMQRAGLQLRTPVLRHGPDLLALFQRW
jgi:FkbM family methyltransferase